MSMLAIALIAIFAPGILIGAMLGIFGGVIAIWIYHHFEPATFVASILFLALGAFTSQISPDPTSPFVTLPEMLAEHWIAYLIAGGVFFITSTLLRIKSPVD